MIHNYLTFPKNASLFLTIAIFAGAIVGIVFRKSIEVFAPIESTVNMFLQTIIVFYIPLSLMYGISNLHEKEARRLLSKAVFFIFLLWSATLLSSLLASLFLPPANPTTIDFTPHARGLYEKLLEYLVPENPFYDAIHNILPPLAIFSLLLAVAYMQSKNKEPLLDVLQEGNHVLEIILFWIAYISPLLAFFHMAKVIGTLNLEVLKAFSFYIAIVIATCLFFALFFLPMLVSLLTPLRYGNLLKRFTYIGLASFGTGQPLIIIPLIQFLLKNIRLRYHFPFRDWRATYLMITPLSFSFAQLGNMLSLFFVFFFGYFFHVSFTPVQELLLPFFSIILSIGVPSLTYENLAILVKQFELPEQTLFYLRKLPDIILNFKTLFNASGVLCLILIVMMLHEKKLKKLGRRAFGFLLFSGLLLTSIYYTIFKAFPIKDYREFIAEKNLDKAIEFLPKIELSSSPTVSPILPTEGSVLRKVLSQRKLTVGFDSDNAPYSYLDHNGEPAGFEIAFMAKLAYDLNVDLELIPLDYETFEKYLNTGLFDIAVGGLMMNFERIQRIALTESYSEDQNVLLVRRDEAVKYKKPLHFLENEKNLKVGGSGVFVKIAQHYFPYAEIVPETDWTDVLSRKIDILFNDRIPSIYWALLHPQVICLDYGEALGREYICYALPLNDRDWKRFVNQWLSLVKLSGFYEQQYNYWFLSETL